MSAELNNLRPFRFWCQKVMPLVYDDSLSYYELLNKVVKYLNDVTENVNSLGTAFQELEDALDHYVDDVVEERLDQMVEDGSLDDIVEEVLNDKFAEYTTETNTRISNLSTTVADHTTRLNDHGTRLYNIESTLATSMVTLPHINATDINAANEFTKESITAWLRYVSAHYGESINARPFMGKYTASVTMLIIGFAYHFTNLIDGLPDYSEFIILAWGGQRLYGFGTNNGVVYFKATEILSDYPPANTTNLAGSGNLERQSLESSVISDDQKETADEVNEVAVEVTKEAEEVPEEDVAEPEPEEEPEVAAEAEEVTEEYEEMPEAEETEEANVDKEVAEPEEDSQIEAGEVIENTPENEVEHPDTEGQEI